jgi:predicted thioesterase
MLEHSIREGMVTDYRKITTSSDAEQSPGSMELYYLVSTTSAINIVIDAASEMLDKHLPPDYITIGTFIELSHEKPTLVGEAINMRVIVKNIEKNRILLEFVGTDSEGRFCSGKCERRIVNKGRLMQSAYGRFPETNKMP